MKRANATAAQWWAKPWCAEGRSVGVIGCGRERTIRRRANRLRASRASSSFAPRSDDSFHIAQVVYGNPNPVVQP